MNDIGIMTAAEFLTNYEGNTLFLLTLITSQNLIVIQNIYRYKKLVVFVPILSLWRAMHSFQIAIFYVLTADVIPAEQKIVNLI